MANTAKGLHNMDQQQIIQGVVNKEDLSLTVNGFLVGVVGRKVELTITTTSIANDTEVYNFSENGSDLYELTIIYTDGTRETLLSAERTA